MNQLTNIIKLSVLFLVGVFLAACAGTGTMNSTAASPQKEQLLTQAGFVVKTATTPKQQQQLAALPGNHVRPLSTKANSIMPILRDQEIRSMSAGKNSTTLTSNCCRPSGRRWLKQALPQPASPR